MNIVDSSAMILLKKDSLFSTDLRHIFRGVAVVVDDSLTLIIPRILLSVQIKRNRLAFSRHCPYTIGICLLETFGISVSWFLHMNILDECI